MISPGEAKVLAAVMIGAAFLIMLLVALLSKPDAGTFPQPRSFGIDPASKGGDYGLTVSARANPDGSFTIEEMSAKAIAAKHESVTLSRYRPGEMIELLAKYGRDGGVTGLSFARRPPEPEIDWAPPSPPRFYGSEIKPPDLPTITMPPLNISDMMGKLDLRDPFSPRVMPLSGSEIRRAQMAAGTLNLTGNGRPLPGVRYYTDRIGRLQEKPRIALNDGLSFGLGTGRYRWRCEGIGCAGYGNTQLEAFLKWGRTVMSRWGEHYLPQTPSKSVPKTMVYDDQRTQFFDQVQREGGL